MADPGVLHGVTQRGLRRALEGRTFGEPGRHGKWLIARTDGPVLMVHFGMTGRLVCCRAGDPPHPHDRVVFRFADAQLRYRDQRKLQGIRLAADESEVEEFLAGLGPDAQTVSRAELDDVLSARRGRVKAVLIDQSALAGLGNLLGDEILWRARVHPYRPANDLTEDERRRLYTELRRVLRAAVRAGCVPGRPDWLTGRRDDPDPRCPRCGHPLRRGRVAGRATVWCPHCQPG